MFSISGVPVRISCLLAVSLTDDVEALLWSGLGLARRANKDPRRQYQTPAMNGETSSRNNEISANTDSQPIIVFSSSFGTTITTITNCTRPKIRPAQATRPEGYDRLLALIVTGKASIAANCLLDIGADTTINGDWCGDSRLKSLHAFLTRPITGPGWHPACMAYW